MLNCSYLYSVYNPGFFNYISKVSRYKRVLIFVVILITFFLVNTLMACIVATALLHFNNTRTRILYDVIRECLPCNAQYADKYTPRCYERHNIRVLNMLITRGLSILIRV